MANWSGASGSRWYRILPLLPLFLAVTSCLVIVFSPFTRAGGMTEAPARTVRTQA